MKAVTTITISKEVEKNAVIAARFFKRNKQLLENPSKEIKQAVEDLFVRHGETVEVEIDYIEDEKAEDPLSEKEKVDRFIAELDALEKKYGVGVRFSTYTDREMIRVKDSKEEYEWDYDYDI